jgi:hypothetical protein
MLKPLTDSFKQAYPHEAAARAERRKTERNQADHDFEAHRDICTECKGKSFNEVKHYEHPCDRGAILALKASYAHRRVIGS